jgi:hypothetical protein
MARYPEAPDDPSDFLAELERHMVDVEWDPFVPENGAPEDPYDEAGALSAHGQSAARLAAELGIGLVDGALGLPGAWIDPDTPRLELARFPVIGATFATGKAGTLRLTLAIEREFKYHAMPVTDWGGVQLECIFTRALLPGETVEDVDG